MKIIGKTDKALIVEATPAELNTFVDYEGTLDLNSVTIGEEVSISALAKKLNTTSKLSSTLTGIKDGLVNIADSVEAMKTSL